jgi:hypothetical protein
LWKEEMVEKNQEVRQQTFKYKFPVNGRSHDLTRVLQHLFLQRTFKKNCTCKVFSMLKSRYKNVMNRNVFCREYCMSYRGPGFFLVVWYGSSPAPLSRQQVVSRSQSPCVSPFSSLLMVGVGEEPNYTTARKPGPL